MWIKPESNSSQWDKSMNMILKENISPGFDSDVFDSQYCFRLILDAMAKPGTKQDFNLSMTSPQNIYSSTAAAILTLLDPDTPFFMCNENREIQQWIRFHCGARPSESKKESEFAVVLNNESLDIQEFSFGTFVRPDLSTTFIIQTDKILESQKKETLTLNGPGIKDSRYIDIEGIDLNILRERKSFVFPTGADFILTDKDGFLAIPRTTIIKGL